MSHIRSKRKRNGNKIRKTEVRILKAFFLPSCFAKGALLHIENWQENQKLAFFNEKVSKLSKKTPKSVHTDDLTKKVPLLPEMSCYPKIWTVSDKSQL